MRRPELSQAPTSPMRGAAGRGARTVGRARSSINGAERRAPATIQSEAATTMRLRITAAAAVAVCLLVAALPVFARDGGPATATHPLVGARVVTIDTGIDGYHEALFTFHADGTVIATDGGRPYLVWGLGGDRRADRALRRHRAGAPDAGGPIVLRHGGRRRDGEHVCSIDGAAGGRRPYPGDADLGRMRSLATVARVPVPVRYHPVQSERVSPLSEKEEALAVQGMARRW
jgi:hypothetical protein